MTKSEPRPQPKRDAEDWSKKMLSHHDWAESGSVRKTGPKFLDEFTVCCLSPSFPNSLGKRCWSELFLLLSVVIFVGEAVLNYRRLLWWWMFILPVNAFSASMWINALNEQKYLWLTNRALEHVAFFSELVKSVCSSSSCVATCVFSKVQV